jgi:hypothetical protein
MVQVQHKGFSSRRERKRHSTSKRTAHKEVRTALISGEMCHFIRSRVFFSLAISPISIFHLFIRERLRPKQSDLGGGTQTGNFYLSPHTLFLSLPPSQSHYISARHSPQFHSHSSSPLASSRLSPLSSLSCFIRVIYVN